MPPLDMMVPVDDPFGTYPTFVPAVDNFTPAKCSYFTVDKLLNATFDKHFNLLMLNIRSCKKNFNQFLAYFSDLLTYFSCIVFIETWLTPERDNIFNLPGFYCYNLYRNHHGGGIKLYLKTGIQSRLLNNFTLLNDMLEMLTVEIMLENFKFVLSTLYHPPTSSHITNNAFIDLFTLQLRQLIDLKVPLIISGDTNLNLLNPNNYMYINTFIKNLFEVGMVPLVTIPTKVNIDNSVTKFSILDQIWASSNVQEQQAFVVPLDITDHYPVGVFLEFPFSYHHSCFNLGYSRHNRPLSANGKITFTTLIANVKPDVITGDLNGSFENYFTKIFKAYDVAFPVVVSSLKPKHSVPWLSYKLKLCIKKKTKLYKLHMKGKISKADYTVYKNRLTAVLRRSKRLYYSKLLFNACNNTSKMWCCLNTLMERKNCQSLEQVSVGGSLLTGTDLANYANKYFVSAASSLTKNLSAPSTYVFMTVPTPVSCFFNPTDNTEVIGVIRSLKSNGNRVLDLSPLVLKENMHLFSRHLADLFNFSLSEGEFPDALKIARVTPVHKAGSCDVIDNFRPISVLPLISKVLEKLTLARMHHFIHRHNILSPCQFGFRRGRGTTHAVIKLLSYIIPAYHHKIYSACFFLDLKKAFDTIDHNLLLQKLDHFGFRGHCLKYLSSYYCNRKQFVHLKGHNSEIMPVTTGVPQGSILGPLCFSLFFNDIPLAVEADTVLFADDAAFVISSPTLPELYLKIGLLFQAIAKYLNLNKLVPNSSKSKLMMFSSCPARELPDLIFAGAAIEWVNEFKYLGLTITNSLSFSKHIDNIAMNISRITGSFINLRMIIPAYFLIKLYYALALPYLTNHIIVWGAAPHCHLQKLMTRVNNLLRMILGVGWVNGRPTVSTDELYDSLGILKITSLFKYNLFKFLRLLLDGKLPDFYNLLLSPYLSSRSYNTRAGKFRHPALVCEVERRALSHQLIMLYDSVPENLFHIPFSTSLCTFKDMLVLNQ